MEVWGDAISKAAAATGRGSKAVSAVVEALSPCNLRVHGIRRVNCKAINRITTAAGRSFALKAGDPIKLDKNRFTNHTATLRAFAPHSRMA
jgi:hypothetical protein